VADAIPVRHLPPEALGESKENQQQVSPSLLRQPPAEVYRLAPGDLLGIWIEGVLGEKTAPPPVQFREQGNLPPALGYPIPVREDGTLALPLVPPVKVAGLSMPQAQDAIVKAYTETAHIIQPGRERVIVTLQRPRMYHVLVMREDGGSVTSGVSGVASGFTTGGNFVSQTRRSAGFPLDLPAYENDLLNALMRTGGLPGLDAERDVIIQRGSAPQGGAQDGACKLPPTSPDLPADAAARPSSGGIQTIQIPIWLRPGEQPSFRPEDIVLQNGDVVYVQSRKTEYFYTGGILPPRAWPLPPDRDLNVIQAILVVGGYVVNGGFNTNNFTGATIQTGLGSPSPSLVTILRKTATGGQIPIRVSINRALRDPRERVLIMPDDIIVLNQTMGEAVSNYISQQLRFGFFGTIIRERDLTGTATLSLP
jgi:hypothetical protein